MGAGMADDDRLDGGGDPYHRRDVKRRDMHHRSDMHHQWWYERSRKR